LCDDKQKTCTSSMNKTK